MFALCLFVLCRSFVFADVFVLLAFQRLRSFRVSCFVFRLFLLLCVVAVVFVFVVAVLLRLFLYVFCVCVCFVLVVAVCSFWL